MGNCDHPQGFVYLEAVEDSYDPTKLHGHKQVETEILACPLCGEEE